MTEKLSAYNQKRNFDKTLEPEGETAGTEGALRFVIQHHMARSGHYDFRLEWEGVLLSWAVPKGPSYDTRDKRLAVQVEDHPLEYRNFEGKIPKGEYGGGTVMLWDEGTWEPLSDVREGLKGGSLKFILKGRRIKGKWALVRMKGKGGDGGENWLLLKEKDGYANTGNGISEFNTSIRTGRTMVEIENGEDEKVIKNPFDRIDVQLAELVHTVPKDEGWLYELKYDGYRIIAFVEGNSIRLITRNKNDYTNRFRGIAVSLLDWASGRAMVLDGEMVVADASGRTDFQALQNHLKNSKSQDLTYIIFDLIALDGVDLREQRLTQRKEMLQTLMKDAPQNLRYSRHVSGNGEECFKAARELGMEGIVGKKADSIYSGARNGDWVKLKCKKRQEFVIGGFTLSDKKTSGVSSLLLGVYDGDKLVYVGRAGTGFRELDRKELEKGFESLKRTTSPFKPAPESRTNEKITWLEPELAAEIEFAEWTEDGLLRQTSFKGLRTDKDPGEVKKEQAPAEPEPPSSEDLEKPMETNSIIIEGIKITNPDKVIFDDPEITKGDVIRYYAQVSARMLPYVSHRILSIVRCPKGVSQSCFFKKHPGSSDKGIVTMPIFNSDGETEDYFYIEDVSGLISEAQMGTLEFHIWGSRAESLEKPDMMVFDLDPDEGMLLDTVRQGVRDIKEILSELSLTSYLKTSGGKGYHVVVPFQSGVSWDVFHDFAKRVAEVMEKKWPDRYTSNVRKAKRTDKIFIDWIRNGRGATSVAPYSIRARKGARVSMPIGWDELDAVAPGGVDMKDALSRMDGNDPWKDFFQSHQLLKF
ncbi:DNA ligase D [uncultured Eubacteriales bacterium]|uniref:DNA ligase (ATP) n=1 Tax=uncultured Eubacteriales bacterium TaxID=172733 RepID=A0A212KHK0_9FIRM|nr:DNA ligase D [uncultured Eubacteriales bacterium]